MSGGLIVEQGMENMADDSDGRCTRVGTTAWS